jgi:hypothetical protein
VVVAIIAWQTMQYICTHLSAHRSPQTRQAAQADCTACTACTYQQRVPSSLIVKTHTTASCGTYVVAVAPVSGPFLAPLLAWGSC